MIINSELNLIQRLKWTCNPFNNVWNNCDYHNETLTQADWICMIEKVFCLAVICMAPRVFTCTASWFLFCIYHSFFFLQTEYVFLPHFTLEMNNSKYTFTKVSTYRDLVYICFLLQKIMYNLMCHEHIIMQIIDIFLWVI